MLDIARGAPWPRQYTSRTLRNAFLERRRGREDELANDDAARRAYAEEASTGDLDVIPLWAGEAIDLIHDDACTSAITLRRSGSAEEGTLMANRHFAKLADVWKHLPLVEVLSIERPCRYWESHAGSAAYEMVDDAERRYGALTFIEVAPLQPALARSRYLTHLRSMRGLPGRLASYPGSPMLAALELGPTCSYVFCDLDPESVADLRSAALRLDLASRTEVISADGMTALHEALTSSDPGSTLAHIDPYEPRAVGAGGQSALDLAHELIDRGVSVVYWYGYDRPERRAWAFDELSAGLQRTTVWCGDVMITAPGTAPDGGDLGVATTPGTGFGIVCANVSTATIDACRALGEGLATAYHGIPLPDGRPGGLEFTTRAAS